MLITDIKEVNKSKSEIWIDENLAFVLYKGEIRKLHLQVNQEIPNEVFQEITKVILPKRAKLRAMNLLQSRDYTQKQLRDKLILGGYGDAIIDEAIAYVSGYHYIDDERYARNYILYRMETKSRRKLEMELLQKGINQDLIKKVFEQLSSEGQTIDEMILIQDAIQKKKYNPQLADTKEKQRMYGFLLRKGFSAGNVRKALFSTDSEYFE